MALLLPLRCLGCGEAMPERSDGAAVCTACRLRMGPLPAPRCPRCDLPRGSGTGRPRECGRCREWPAILAAARSATALDGPAEAVVRALKYQGWQGLAPVLGERMARLAVPPTAVGPPTAVVPVPTLPARTRRRGYNQAELLAREVARRRALPLLAVVRRRGSGDSQVSLQVDERAANVEASFEAVPGAEILGRHRHLLVVDDVLTTGATVAAVARVLERLGARAVTALTFARTLPREVDASSE